MRRFLWENKINLFCLATSLLFNILIWFFLYLKTPPNQFPIPLHFDIYQGIDVIDFWYKVFFIPALGLIFIILNFFLAYLIFKKESFFSKMLTCSSMFVQILLGLSLLSIFLID